MKAGGVNLARYDYQVKSDGQRDWVDETTYGPGGQGPVTVRTDWSYDALGRLTMEVRGSAGQGGHYADTYTYDMVGNRLAKMHDADGTDRDLSVAYAYDASDRLLTETATGAGAYTALYGHYDAAGNFMPGYDANGSLLERHRTGTDPEDVAYAYDLRDRLTGSSDNSVTSTYGYDTDGNRVSKSVAGGATSYYLVDTGNPTGYSQVLEEAPVAGGPPTRSYVIGSDVVAQADATAATTYLLYDGHGSTRMLADGSGAVIEGYDYDAFGNALPSSPAFPATTLLYSGEQWDAGLGMQYLRARYYDPRLGRFSAFDNFESDTGDLKNVHRYVYVASDPVNGTDPSGQLFDTASTGTATQGSATIQSQHTSVAATAATWAQVALRAMGQALLRSLQQTVVGTVFGIPTAAGAVWALAQHSLEEVREEVKEEVELAMEQEGVKEVLFHYTSQAHALQIAQTLPFPTMTATGRVQIGRAPRFIIKPAGVWATDITPYDPAYTQQDITDFFGVPDASWFVALSNDNREFEYLNFNAYVKRARADSDVPVDVLTVFWKGMPKW